MRLPGVEMWTCFGALRDESFIGVAALAESRGCVFASGTHAKQASKCLTMPGAGAGLTCQGIKNDYESIQWACI
jgi:hypothetical protein